MIRNTRKLDDQIFCVFFIFIWLVLESSRGFCFIVTMELDELVALGL